jgi:hypothetical protein
MQSRKSAKRNPPLILIAKRNSDCRGYRFLNIQMPIDSVSCFLKEMILEMNFNGTNVHLKRE